MVDLVKARKKAKKTANGERRSAIGEETDKLARFKETAGTRRSAAAVVEASNEQEQLEVLTFRIDGEQYAIEVERVLEIASPRPLTRVPNAGAFVRGVMSLRGIVVTVVDVRGRLRHARAGEGAQVIVVTDGTSHIGFDVDRVLRPAKIEKNAIEPHPVVHASEERPSIRGVFREENALTILLDLDKLIS
jgi:purine-binding chemotaxis protein CheW